MTLPVCTDSCCVRNCLNIEKAVRAEERKHVDFIVETALCSMVGNMKLNGECKRGKVVE